MKTAIEILQELVALKALGEEIGRRRQRRLHSIKRDPFEMETVEKMMAEHVRRRRATWKWADSVLANHTQFGDGSGELELTRQHAKRTKALNDILAREDTEQNEWDAVEVVLPAIMMIAREGLK